MDRLLRAHVALREQRARDGAYGLLPCAREDEFDLIEAVLGHCGVPLLDTLRTTYRRTLGIGNPVSPLHALAAPFLRAALRDQGHGKAVVGLATSGEELERNRDEVALEHPRCLLLSHAAPLGLTGSRNGLWSLKDHAGRTGLPQAQGLVFEAAFAPLSTKSCSCGRCRATSCRVLE